MEEQDEEPIDGRLPVVSLGAEHLVIGSLMRRNIMAYKAPPGNEGYDLICIHPNPRIITPPLRVQVKSRWQTDCDRALIVKTETLDAFDFLVVAFLNIGYASWGRCSSGDGQREPELYTLPNEFVREHHSAGKLGKLRLKGLDLSEYAGVRGCELVALRLGVSYPCRM